LTRLGSWGAQFVHLGCGGFVGTLWPVTDRAAAAFAQALYEWMRQGLLIGEAMRRARQRVRERYPNDPTNLVQSDSSDESSASIGSNCSKPSSVSANSSGSGPESLNRKCPPAFSMRWLMASAWASDSLGPWM
jgi:CHAT domain